MRKIAVVGLACRFPKGLDSIDELWSALSTKINTVTPIPADRWVADRYFAIDEKAKGKGYIDRGNFLKQDIRTFDAHFFDIPPRVAENMDPQQRILLEVVWEAFENAGLDLVAHAGQKVGVYVGGFMLDHMITQMAPANRSLNNQNTAAGMMMTMLSNRISHAFDLRGPSLSIDTACSSSLVAFNYACRDIWNGTCNMAIVGGANVMTRPEYPVGMCKGQFLSRDGQCKSFDARGDGYGRGEGAGVVVLKALDQALADGDTILATVVGTGANSDGRTPGISMPSGDAQRLLIEEVCASFDVRPADVRYVECHGTGTAVGDPIEATSVGSVYGAGKTGDERVVIGSIKSNIGHLEAAAGVAGIIKTVLTLLNRTATPLANLQTPHPDIPFDALGVRLADDLIALPDDGRPVLAAVNSFGYGGTNAHAILQSAPRAQHTDAACESGPRALPFFLPLSTRSPAALKELARRFADRLAPDDAPWQDVVHTAALRRSHLTNRAVVIGETKEALQAGLIALASEAPADSVCSGVQPYTGQRSPVFVFTGMGPQWWAMGQELYRQEPLYRAAVDEADAIFQRIAGFSILAEMLKDEAASSITKTQHAQPANFIVQIGIAAVLRAAGIAPGAIVGHSVGEVSAAYAAGVLSLEDALRVSFHRSRLQATTAGRGRMLAVGLSEEAARAWVEKFEGRIDIAAINGPATLTVAGDDDAIEALAQSLTDAEIFNRALQVEVAYHSHLMDPILGDLQEALASLSPKAPTVPLYSTVTGQKVEGPSYGADYWPLNVRQPVAFMKAIGALIEDGFTTFVEIGPHPVLSSALRDCAKAVGKDLRLVETLRRNEPGERQRVLRAAGNVFATGCAIDWQQLSGSGRFVALPNYPWQRERYWIESDRGTLERIGPVDLPLLGMQEVPASLVWRNDLENEPIRYLKEHVVSGMELMPAAGYLEALFELSAQINPDAQCLVLRNVEIAAPLLITTERAVDFVTAYDPVSRTAAIRSTENGRVGEGQTHVTADVSAQQAAAAQPIDLIQLRARFTKHEDIESFYKSLAGIGLFYGPYFQTVRQLGIDRAKGEVLARIELDERQAPLLDRYHAHPTLLDGCFQALIGMLDGTVTYLPTGFAELRLHRAGLPARFWCHGITVSQTAKRIESDLMLIDDAGELIGVVRGMCAVAATARPGRIDQYGDAVKRQILAYQWAVAGRLSEPKRLGHWLVVEDQRCGISQPLAERLEAFGARVKARVRLGEPGESFSLDGERITVRPGHAEDIAAALQAVGALDGVAFLHGLDATPESGDPVALQAIDLIAGFCKGLIALPREERPRVYAVTQAAFEVEEYDGIVQPSQTAINGFVRVAHNEIEGLNFSSVDLPAADAGEQIEALAFELLCDAPEDEVALRGASRLFSELLETPVLDKPRVAFMPLGADTPVLVRPLQEIDEGTGTLKLVQALPAALGDDEIELHVEAMGLPISTLADPSSDTLEQPYVEVVGHVSATGANVRDLAVGMRVLGFAPAEIASHLRGPRKRFHLVGAPAERDGAELVGNFGLHGCAERAAELAGAEGGATALVFADAMGIAVAAALARRGTRITWLSEAGLPPLAPCDTPSFDATLESIERASACTADPGCTSVGFDFIVAPLSQWTDRFGFRALRDGGSLIDTDALARPLKLPPQASAVIRCDVHTLAQRAKPFAQALSRAVDLLVEGRIATVQNLAMSATDLAWQRLDIPASKVQVVLKFDRDGRDAPVYLQDRSEFHADATYLITGGFGGFGQKTAQWLVDHGARHLVLVGRTGADTEERQAFVRSLEAFGVRVLSAACDSADRAAMGDLFGQLRSGWPPLRGVFHSAAVILDQAIADMDHETFSKVMRSKALSAWVLHQLTAEMPLDHFVLYSSVANSVGNSRQASYVAANGFLDGLAWHRKSLGLAATSVNWGAISDVGVVTRDEKLEQFLRYIGLRGISSQEGLALLGKALLRGVTQFGVTVITNWGDWARYETLGGKSPRFANLIAADSNPADAAVREQLRAELAGLASGERFPVLSSLIAEVIASELQTAAESISVDRPINELGVDSLMATEIQLLLEGKLGIAVSVLELLGDTTIRAITERTLKDLALDAAPEPALAPAA